MSIPSLNDMIAVIVTAIVLAFASGHGDGVWKILGELRRGAITNAHQDWGCPSIFAGKSACKNYDSAQLLEGAKTYVVYLKTLLKDVFFLLPEQKRLTRGDYVILTREPSQTPGRKYFWNNIGECYVLSGANAGLMRLSFDLFGAEDIYMSLHPLNREEQVDATAEAAA